MNVEVTTMFFITRALVFSTSGGNLYPWWEPGLLSHDCGNEVVLRTGCVGTL